MKIEKQILKPLLSREEFIATIQEKTTPSNIALKEKLAKDLGKSADLIVIKRIHQKFGKGEIEATFYIYNNAEAMKTFEKTKVKAAAPAAGA